MRQTNDWKGDASLLQNLRSQHRDLALRIALLNAAQQEAAENDNRMESLPTSSDERRAEVDFVARNQEAMLRLIRERVKKEKPLQHKKPSLLSVLAAAVLLIVFAFSSAMAVSSDLRVYIMKLLYQVTPQYTEFRYVPDESIDLKVPGEWGGNYFPSYIPNGFEYYGVTGEQGMQTCIFMAEGDKVLRFSENAISTEGRFDTEGYQVEDIHIGDSQGLVAFQDGKTKILWSSLDRHFMLTIDADKETAIQVAKQVIKIK